MHLRGERTLAAPPETVFAAIHDPERLLSAIPGCQSVERVTETEYRGRVAIRLPAVGGTYAMTIWLVESRAPTSCLLDGEVEGRTGRATGRVAIHLEPVPGGHGTRLTYDADARLGGPLAWLDSALVARVATSIIDQGLARLADALAGGDPATHDHRDVPDHPRSDRTPSSMETLV